MKKQIFLLLIVVIAGTTMAWGQMLPSSKLPRALQCPSEPLHPRAGVPYKYAASTGGDTEAKLYTWWATKDATFISTLNGATTTNIADSLKKTSTELLNYSANYGQKTATDTVGITWSAEILARTLYQSTPGTDPSPTFVVVMAEGDCSNNIQVYEINPSPSFSLDIANIAPDTYAPLDYGIDTAQCVDIVRKAIYNASSKELDMDYGTDTLYFEVIAANFATSWIPTFTVMNGLTSPQIATIGWSYSLADARAGTFIESHSIQQGVANAVSGTTALTPAANTDISKGVSIYVRVVIENRTHESLSDQAFVLAVDGEDATNQWDIDHATASCDVPGAADQTDTATHIVRARPTINHSTQDSGDPTPNTFIIKTNTP